MIHTFEVKMRSLEVLKETFQGDKFRQLTFFVTTKCNAKCKHCFYWESLNQKIDELSLDEIKKISSTMPEFPVLSISGGEPYLRLDLAEICEVFYNQNKVKEIYIPTNSLLLSNVKKITESMLKKCPEAKITLNISLDGLHEIHDDIRGVKGNFKKVEENIDNLNELKRKYKNLSVNVSTVITNKTVDKMQDLINYVKKNMKVDSHNFEVMRGDPLDKTYKPVTSEEFKDLTEEAIEVRNYYAKKEKNWLKAKIIEGRLRYFYDLQKRFLDGKTWDIRCKAGITMAVLEPAGDLRVCEILGNNGIIGNLRNVNHDFNVLWNSEKAEQIRKWIKDTKCSCTHCIGLYNTIQHNFKANFIKPILYSVKR